MKLLSSHQKFVALGIFTLSAGLSTLLPHAANAVVLEQKWQAGQQLAYDVNIGGTMHLTAPEDVPMIGGLPLEIMLKGDGQNTFDTREVDEFGTAIVALRLDRMQLKVNETTFNQNGVLGIRDGRASLSLNGQSIMPTRDVSQYLTPSYGLRITKHFHVVGTAPLEAEDATSAKTSDATAEDKNKVENKVGDKASGLKIPMQTMMVLQAIMARSLPALLPAKDVNLGDAWTANIQWPQAPNAPRAEFQKPAGEFNLKALAEEEVLGRKTWRIAVDGNLLVAEAQTKIIGDEIEKRRGEKTAAPDLPGGIKLPKLFALTQKVNGNVWFDAVAGQLVRTDLQLNTTGKTRKDEKSKSDGDFDFAGNLKMELRKVSYEGQPR